MKEGLKQGDVLSPTHFNIYMVDIMKESNKNTQSLCVWAIKIYKGLYEGVFADVLT